MTAHPNVASQWFPFKLCHIASTWLMVISTMVPVIFYKIVLFDVGRVEHLAEHCPRQTWGS